MAFLEISGCLARLTSLSQLNRADREALIAVVVSHLPGAMRSKLPPDPNDARVKADVTGYLAETDAYVTASATINGVDLDARGSAKVVVYPQIDAVLSSNASFAAGGIRLSARKAFVLDTRIVKGSHIPLGSFTRSGGRSTIGGFGIGGDVKVALVPGGAQLDLHLRLADSLSLLGVPALADAQLRVTPTGQPVLDGARVGPFDATLGGSDGLGLRDTLADFGVTRALVAPAAIGIPALELILAAALLPARTSATAAGLAAALLAVFAAALAVAVLRPEPVACRCFGTLSAALVGPWTVARTVALATLATAVAVAGGDDPGPSAVAWVGELRTGEAVALTGVLLLGLVAAAQAGFSWQLLAQSGRLVWRLEEVTAGAGGRFDELAAPLLPGAPGVGDLAPDVALADLGGAEVRLSALHDGERDMALVFTDPSCSACEPVLDEVARARRAGDAAVVLVGGGDAAANAAKAERHGIDGVLLDHDGTTSLALGVAGLAGAVLVDRTGRIASEPALGPDAVRELLASTAPAALEVLAAGGQR